MAFEKRLNISQKIKIKPFHFMIHLKYYFISYFSYKKTLYNPVFFVSLKKTFDIIFVYLTALVFLCQNKCIYFIHNSTGDNRCNHVTSSLRYYDFYLHVHFHGSGDVDLKSGDCGIFKFRGEPGIRGDVDT